MFTLIREEGKDVGIYVFLLIHLIICGAIWPFLSLIVAFFVYTISESGIVTSHGGQSVTTISNSIVVFLLFFVASVIHVGRLVYYKRKFSQDYRKMRAEIKSEPTKFKSDWIRIGIWFAIILLLAGIVAIWLVAKPRDITASIFSFSICTLIAFYVVGGVLDFFRYLPLLGR